MEQKRLGLRHFARVISGMPAAALNPAVQLFGIKMQFPVFFYAGQILLADQAGELLSIDVQVLNDFVNTQQS